VVLPGPSPTTSNASGFAAAALQPWQSTSLKIPSVVPLPTIPAKKASWVVRGVFLTHKYTDPTQVDITATNAGEQSAGNDEQRAG
jgi:hypothetical protein